MKNLLIITQKVDINDDVLGFFHGWIIEFAKKFKKVTVICLKQGDYNLPSNVKVLSLGKEMGRTKLGYLFYFYKYIWEERQNYDAVFIHMNPRYIVYGGWPWKLMGKKISLWYAHGHVNLMLEFAAIMADIIFTSTSEGFRLKSRKTIVVGQGIDTDLFRPTKPTSEVSSPTENVGVDDQKIKIVSVGRISPSKDYETLIRSIKLLADDNVSVKIAGQPATKTDEEYFLELKTKIQENGLADKIIFVGPIANKELPEFLQSADIFVNMSHTGSLDKAILEAMACGLPVLTCNEALKSVLESYGDELMYPKKDYKKLASDLKKLVAMFGEERGELGLALREIVIKNHNLKNLIAKISQILINE